MGDTYSGGMSLPGVMGLKVSRPMASLMVTADELTFTAVSPLSWLIRPRHISRSDVLAIRATAAGFGVSGLDVHTRNHDVFTFWTSEVALVSGRLAELGYPVRAPL